MAIIIIHLEVSYVHKFQQQPIDGSTVTPMNSLYEWSVIPLGESFAKHTHTYDSEKAEEEVRFKDHLYQTPDD